MKKRRILILFAAVVLSASFSVSPRLRSVSSRICLCLCGEPDGGLSDNLPGQVYEATGWE